jgi:autotransporter translocation and assembly factor TamB
VSANRQAPNLTNLSEEQASSGASAARSQEAEGKAQTSGDRTTLNALEKKLQQDSTELANSEAEVKAGIAQSNAFASSVSLQGLIQMRAAAALVVASTELTGRPRLSTRTRQLISQRPRTCARMPTGSPVRSPPSPPRLPRCPNSLPFAPM